MQLEIAFGQVLREFRVKSGLSQEALALESGVDRTYVSLLERGKRQPTITMIFVLCNTLSVEPDFVVKRVRLLMEEQGGSKRKKKGGD